MWYLIVSIPDLCTLTYFVLLSGLFIAVLFLALGKGWPHGSLERDVICLCFCHFTMWCPESGVVLDCTDS